MWFFGIGMAAWHGMLLAMPATETPNSFRERLRRERIAAHLVKELEMDIQEYGPEWFTEESRR